MKNFDARVRERFPGVPVRWAYTSLLLRERLAKARQKSDSVLKAFGRLSFEKFTEVALQPLQTIPGREHGEVCAAASEAVAEDGLICRVGAPLLGHARGCAASGFGADASFAVGARSRRGCGAHGSRRRHAAVAVMKIWPVPCAIWMRMCMWGQ